MLRWFIEKLIHHLFKLLSRESTNPDSIVWDQCGYLWKNLYEDVFYIRWRFESCIIRQVYDKISTPSIKTCNFRILFKEWRGGRGGGGWAKNAISLGIIFNSNNFNKVINFFELLDEANIDYYIKFKSAMLNNQLT